MRPFDSPPIPRPGLRRRPQARQTLRPRLPLWPLLAAACALGALGPTSAARAQAAGSWLVRGGVTQIAPDVRSGDLSAPAFFGTKSDVRADTQPTAGLTWMATDHLALDLPLSAGFQHEIVGDGAIAGTGVIATVKALPATLFVQYRFGEAQARWRPYLGAGPTYAYFFDERTRMSLTALTGGNAANPTTMKVAARWGYTVQAGAAVALGERWFADLMVAKTRIGTTVSLSTGQTQDLRLDPWSFALAIGYRF